MENTIKVIKRVEKTHKNLGIPSVFAKLCDIANLGCLLVAERGRGKEATMNVIKQLRHRDVLEISRLTPAGIAGIAPQLNGHELTMINPDISSVYTDYLKDAFINVISHLISEHRIPASYTAQYKYTVSDCTISFISGAQSKMIRKLQQLPSWESMYKDRLLRFYMFYPRGTPNYVDFMPDVGEITMGGSTVESISIPRSIMEDEKYLRLLILMRIQTSEGRSKTYLNRLLKASAWLNQRDVVTSGDLEFLNACGLNLHTEYMLSERETVSSPLLLNPDSYVLLFYIVEKENVTRKELREYFKMSRAKLDRQIQPLMASNILKGTFGKDELSLNNEWREKYVEPILRLYESYGVN